MIEVDVPEVKSLVAVGNLPAVRGPGWGVVETGRFAEVDLTHLAHAVLASKMEGVLAGRVGEVGDRLTVRGPGGIPLGNTGRVRQIADVALLGGNGEDLA